MGLISRLTMNFVTTSDMSILPLNTVSILARPQFTTLPMLSFFFGGCTSTSVLVAVMVVRLVTYDVVNGSADTLYSGRQRVTAVARVKMRVVNFFMVYQCIRARPLHTMTSNLVYYIKIDTTQRPKAHTVCLSK